jgi:hypothetical protein
VTSIEGGSVARIKGTVLIDTIAAIKQRAGEAEFAKIVAHLGAEARDIFAATVQPSTWYPLDAFVEFLEVDIRETANGDREVLAKRAEQVIESQLRGVYKVFVKFGSPAFVITRIAAVHATYFQGVQIIPEIEHNKALIKYIGFAKHQDIMGYTIIGFFRKALEISSAKGGAVKFTVPYRRADLPS